LRASRRAFDRQKDFLRKPPVQESKPALDEAGAFGLAADGNAPAGASLRTENYQVRVDICAASKSVTAAAASAREPSGGIYD